MSSAAQFKSRQLAHASSEFAPTGQSGGIGLTGCHQRHGLRRSQRSEQRSLLRPTRYKYDANNFKRRFRQTEAGGPNVHFILFNATVASDYGRFANQAHNPLIA